MRGWKNRMYLDRIVDNPSALFIETSVAEDHKYVTDALSSC